jgi:hypothetical protein
MDSTELLKLLPGAIGFFAIDDFPGVILKDQQGWLFEGDTVPHPITRTEAKQRGGSTVDIEEAAELFTMQPSALEFLKKNATNKSFTDLTKLGTGRASGQMKARVVKNRDTNIQTE